MFIMKYADKQMDWTLRRVSRSWHFSISTISRLWEKYHQKCKIMNVHLIHLQQYSINVVGLFHCM